GVQHRVADGSGRAREHAVTIDALAGDAIEALGQVQAPNAQLRPAAAGYVNRASVAGKNVAGTLDAEIHVTIHESGLIPPHHAVAVGEAADVIGGGQLDQRNASAGFFIDDCDFEIVCG